MKQKNIINIIHIFSLNLNKYLSLIFGFILLFCFVTSLLFGYKGNHWVDSVNPKNIYYLNASTIILATGIIIFYSIYKIKITNIIYNITDRINIKQIFFIALIIRLSWVYFSDNIQISDFNEFNSYAIEILNGSKNILDFIDGSRSIGISVVISIIYYLFGVNEIYPLIFIAILSSLQIYFIFHIVKLFSSNSIAILASLLLTFLPEHILLTNLLGTDVLYSTLIYFSIFLISISKNDKFITLFLAGIILGLAHWTRPTALLFFFSMILYLIPNKNLRFISRRIFFFCLGFIIVISPIISYNYLKSNTFDINPIHGQFGKSLLIGTFFKGDGRYKGWAKYENHHYLDLELENYVNENYENNNYDLLRLEDTVFTQIAIDRIIEEPYRFYSLVIKHKLTNLWGLVAGLSFSLDKSKFSKYKNLIWAYSEIFHRLIILFCALSLIFLFLNGNINFDIRFIIIISAILTTIMHIFLESHPRYHHVFLPIFIIYISEYVLINKQT